MGETMATATPDDDSHRLQLLVDNDNDRKALESMLTERYAVISSDEIEAVDCLLIDEQLLSKHRGAIRRLKGEAHPTFQPVLLLRQSSTQSPHLDVATDASDDPPLIDEIVTAPIDQHTLFRRLENLLVRRRQSAELSEQYQTVQAQFERLFNATNDAIFVIDPTENEITECNPAAVELTGRSQAAVLDTPPNELFTSETTTSTTAFIDSVVETGEGWSDEFVCQGKSDDRHVEIAATSFEAEQEDISVLFSIRDVTERKAYQSELELTTQAIESAPIGISISDPTQSDNPLIYTNEGFTQITGYASSEIEGRNCRFLQGPGTREEPVAELRNAIDNEESTTVELRNYRKDGTPFWNEVTIAPVEADGEVVNYVGFQRDVTDRKERELNLTLFKKAVESSGNAVVITDRNGVIEYVNPAFESQTGYSREEMLEENPNILSSGRQSDEFYDALWETILDGEKWEAELINQRKSGELYRVEQEIAPIRNTVGEISHFVAIERDVTDRRLREQQLAVLNRILRHNLRNGMNVIEGNAALLADIVTDEQATEFIDAIRDRTDELAALGEKAATIRTLFDHDQPHSTGYPIHSLVADIEDELREMDPEIALQRSISGEFAVAGDSRLQLALIELMSYTLEYNQTAEPEINLTAAPDSDRSDEWITITVWDNGDGIPKHEWKPIASGEETPLEHGTGLGLWLVHWTVSLLGGEVSIESVDSGTQVIVTLPRATPEPVESQ